MALTTALEPVLAAAPSARVLTLTSRLHQPGSRGDPVDFAFDDPNFKHGYSPDRAYKNSETRRDLGEQRTQPPIAGTVTADAICPGFVPTTAAACTSGLATLPAPSRPAATELYDDRCAGRGRCRLGPRCARACWIGWPLSA